MTLACPTGCAACCRSVGRIRDLMPPGWPIDDDGACGHIAPDGRCGIYDRRPTVCRVGDMRPAEIPEADWFSANVEACAGLQVAAGLDASSLVPTILLESPCSASSS